MVEDSVIDIWPVKPFETVIVIKGYTNKEKCIEFNFKTFLIKLIDSIESECSWFDEEDSEGSGACLALKDSCSPRSPYERRVQEASRPGKGAMTVKTLPCFCRDNPGHLSS